VTGDVGLEASSRRNHGAFMVRLLLGLGGAVYGVPMTSQYGSHPGRRFTTFESWLTLGWAWGL
jgi:hypothetical protein